MYPTQHNVQSDILKNLRGVKIHSGLWFSGFQSMVNGFHHFGWQLWQNILERTCVRKGISPHSNWTGLGRQRQRWRASDLLSLSHAPGETMTAESRWILLFDQILLLSAIPKLSIWPLVLRQLGITQKASYYCMFYSSYWGANDWSKPHFPPIVP